ncbi:hypothetical protein O9993_02375 [Vibrio lentus]|nr:hypothetical protein [Vibrio lentus]
MKSWMCPSTSSQLARARDISRCDLMELSLWMLSRWNTCQNMRRCLLKNYQPTVKMGRSGEKLAVQISEKFKDRTWLKTDLAFLGKDLMSELENSDDND